MRGSLRLCYPENCIEIRRQEKYKYAWGGGRDRQDDARGASSCGAQSSIPSPLYTVLYTQSSIPSPLAGPQQPDVMGGLAGFCVHPKTPQTRARNCPTPCRSLCSVRITLNQACSVLGNHTGDAGPPSNGAAECQRDLLHKPGFCRGLRTECV